MKFQVGSIVQFAHITHDDFDRLITTPPSPKKVVRINTAQVPHRSFDYEIESQDGNHFFVYEHEIEDFMFPLRMQCQEGYENPLNCTCPENF